jgi:hypothetical protein
MPNHGLTASRPRTYRFGLRPLPNATPVPRSVLIVKLAAIGDVVMALPMVTALRSAESGTRITWLCGATVAPLLRCVDGIDELVVVEDVAVQVDALLAR